MWTIELRGEQRQEQMGGYLARLCLPPCIIYLQGDLGTGKTTLVRGFLHGLGHRGKVKSPTYTLLEPYELKDCVCYHFDLYRLAAADELEFLGLEDLLENQAILLVEWPERGAGVLPAADLLIQLEHAGTVRRLHLSGVSEAGRAIERALLGVSAETFRPNSHDDSG